MLVPNALLPPSAPAATYPGVAGPAGGFCAAVPEVPPAAACLSP